MNGQHQGDGAHARVPSQSAASFVGGRFTVRRQLGEGAQGAVYAVYDAKRRCDVALKVLSRMEPTLLYRFKREFREVAEIVHPRLATLYEFFGADGTFCFTMELVEGVDWFSHVTGLSLEGNDETRTGLPSSGTSTFASEFVTRVGTDSQDGRPSVPPEIAVTPAIPRVPPAAELDESRLRAALRGLVEGVCAMHEAGKLHLDLKPSNVMVRPDGSICILDFGLTQSSEPGDGESLIGGGTPAFMAPEQGKRALTPAADWYAVGAMLYQALTGTTPFIGDANALIAAKRVRPPVHPNMLKKGLPQDLADLAMELLVRTPAHRAPVSQIRRVAGLENFSGQTSGVRAVGISDCVGREHELGVLGRVFERVQTGGFHVALVRGASGIGKSTVVEAFLQHIASATPDCWTLRGRCYETEFLPYRGLDGIMDQLSGRLTSLDREARRELLPPHFISLSEIFPVLRRAADGSLLPPDAQDRDPLETKRRGVQALRALLTRLRQTRPLVLYIDDMQWADGDTLGLLLDMFVPADTPPVMLLVTAREDELAELPELQETIAALNDWADGFTMIDLPPLPREALERLARHEASDLSDERVDQLIADSGGSPFLLQELLRSQASGHTGNLDEILVRRVDDLSEQARSLVHTLAVAGRPLDLEVAFECVQATMGVEGSPRENPSAIIAQLKAGRLIRVRSDATTQGDEDVSRLECYHDRIRESVSAALGDEARRATHGRIAHSLIGRDANPEHIVQHLGSAGGTEQITPYALAAAESATASFAFDRAAHFLDLAERHSTSQGEALGLIQARRAQALVQAGRTQQAVPVLLRAAEHHEDRLMLKGQAAGHLMEGGKITEGMQVAESVLREVGAHLPKTRLGAMWMFLMSDLRLRLRRFKLGHVKSDERRAHLARIADTYLWFGKGFSVAMPGHAAAFFAKASLLACQIGDSHRYAIALGSHACMVAAFFPKRVEHLVQLATDHARRAEESLPALFAIAARAYGQYFDGNFKGAYEHATDTLNRLRALPRRHAFEEERMELVRCFAGIFLGRLAEMQREIPRQIRELERRGDEFGAALLRTGAGPTHFITLDQPERVEEALARVQDFERIPGDYLSFYEALASCSLALYRDDTEAAFEQFLRGESAWRRSGMIAMPVGDAMFRAFVCQLGIRLLGRASPKRRAQVLRRVRRDMKRLSRSRLDYGRIVSVSLSSALAAAEGNQELAIARLREVESLCLNVSLMGTVHSARWLRGTLMQNEEGRRLAQEALIELGHQGVADPAKFVRTLTPFPPELLGVSSQPTATL